MVITKDVEHALKWLAAEFNELRTLYKDLQDLEDQPLKEQEKRLKKDVKVIKYIGRAEKRENNFLKDVLKELDDVKGEQITEAQLQSVLNELRIPSLKLTKECSRFVGELAQHLKDLRTDVAIAARHPDQEHRKIVQNEIAELELEIKIIEEWNAALIVALKKADKLFADIPNKFSLPDPVITRVKKLMLWYKGCPIDLVDLSYLEILYHDFNGNEKMGELIVHKALAEEVLEIFADLFKIGFKIYNLELSPNFLMLKEPLPDDFNNTSAFGCRPMSTNKSSFSYHSYGQAIDINPMINPYFRLVPDLDKLSDKTTVRKITKIAPKKGKKYSVNRTKQIPGIILKDEVCYKIFADRGWFWGGDWNDDKDLHHFQKTKKMFK
jgi:hypothetical protein